MLPLAMGDRLDSSSSVEFSPAEAGTPAGMDGKQTAASQRPDKLWSSGSTPLREEQGRCSAAETPTFRANLPAKAQVACRQQRGGAGRDGAHQSTSCGS